MSPELSGHAVSAGRATAEQWIVLYDADCGFCKWLLSGLLIWDRERRLRPVGLQSTEAADLLADLVPAERMGSFHVVSPTGERRSGGLAVPTLLRQLPAGHLPATALDRIPRVTDRGYRWVATHRTQLSRAVPSRLKRSAGRFIEQFENS